MELETTFHKNNSMHTYLNVGKGSICWVLTVVADFAYIIVDKIALQNLPLEKRLNPGHQTRKLTYISRYASCSALQLP